MIKVVGVRFRAAGKIYFFDPLNFQIKKGEHVIVETARGVEYGTVVGEMKEVEDSRVVQPRPFLHLCREQQTLTLDLRRFRLDVAAAADCQSVSRDVAAIKTQHTGDCVPKG